MPCALQGTCMQPKVSICPHLIDALQLFRSHLGCASIEILQALYLDPDGRRLGHRIHSFGTADQTWMPVQGILGLAVHLGASAVLIAHNHPNGVPHPSVQDRRATLQMARAAADRGILLVDHLVLTQTEFCSIRERFEMRPLRCSARYLGWCTPPSCWPGGVRQA